MAPSEPASQVRPLVSQASSVAAAVAAAPEPPTTEKKDQKTPDAFDEDTAEQRIVRPR